MQMTRPELALLVDHLRAFVQAEGLQPDPNFTPWNSGVYAVLDCVYSSQARYASVVLPLLQQRFPALSGLKDVPELRFSDFLHSLGPEPTVEGFATYARQVMENRQQLSGRLKVQVAYDVCHFFVQRGLETRADLLALGNEALARLVLDDLVNSVRGIGPVLARYLLLLLGLEQYVKPDTLLSRLIGRLVDWQPTLGNETDMNLIQAAVSAVAAEMRTTPARLDNALWLYESTGMASKPKPRSVPQPDHPAVPRTLAHAADLDRRRFLLSEPHHLPLTTFVQLLREQLETRALDVPDLDPVGGGTSARILYLMEAPGARAVRSRGGSGFVSMDNNDQTAQTVFQMTRQAGVDRASVLLWNIVSWYVGDEERIRAVRPEEVEEGRAHLRQLLHLLPELQVVITLGQPAALGWSKLAPNFPQVTTLTTWHPSGQALNAHPRRRAHLLSTLQLAQQLTEYLSDESMPSWGRNGKIQN